jgi:carbon storage regulator
MPVPLWALISPPGNDCYRALRLSLPTGTRVRPRYGDRALLVVSRKLGERILIGDKIAITVVKINGSGVRIGVEAPPELAIMREELAEELNRAEQVQAQQANAE